MSCTRTIEKLGSTNCLLPGRGPSPPHRRGCLGGRGGPSAEPLYAQGPLSREPRLEGYDWGDGLGGRGRRCALYVKDFHLYKDWCVAHHGTTSQNLPSILLQGLQNPGEPGVSILHGQSYSQTKRTIIPQSVDRIRRVSRLCRALQPCRSKPLGTGVLALAVADWRWCCAGAGAVLTLVSWR